MLRTRAQQFGVHYDGYFVMFLRPKKLRYMSSVDYVVVRGLKTAIQTADAAEAWELEGWFPETEAGCLKANDLAEALRKKNTIEMMVFE